MSASFRRRLALVEERVLPRPSVDVCEAFAIFLCSDPETRTEEEHAVLAAAARSSETLRGLLADEGGRGES